MKKAKVFVVANEKGGVGKTTTSLAIASILSSARHKTLLIDADPQGNASDTYRAEKDGVATLYDVILESEENRVDINEAIQHTDCGDIVAGEKLLLRAEVLMNEDPTSIYNLRNALQSLDKSYEFVVIDTGPKLDKMLFNALIAADEVIIPLEASRYSVAGLTELNNTIVKVQKTFNPNITISGLLFVKFNERTRVSKSAEIALCKFAEKMGTQVFPTAIRSSVKQVEAQEQRTTLIKYAPHSTTERDYESFVSLLIGEEV